jgi:hypothetical protein
MGAIKQGCGCNPPRVMAPAIDTPACNLSTPSLLSQIRTALMTWVQRECNTQQPALAPFLRNKVAQCLVAVLQVRCLRVRQKGRPSTRAGRLGADGRVGAGSGDFGRRVLQLESVPGGGKGKVPAGGKGKVPAGGKGKTRSPQQGRAKFRLQLTASEWTSPRLSWMLVTYSGLPL